MSKSLKVAPGRRGTVINTFINANTIFIGLPLNIALLGMMPLAYFLIYYITNTISTWTFRCLLMTSDSKDGKKKQESHFRLEEITSSSITWVYCFCSIFSNQYSPPSFVSSTFGIYRKLTTPLRSYISE